MLNSSWQKTLSLVGLALATAAAFWPSLFNGFAHWDDVLLVVTNPLVTAPERGRFFDIFTTMVGKTYVPLTILSFSVEHFFFGLTPFIYHLDNLLLHLGVAVLVWWLCLRLRLPLLAAFMAALLFAIHPMRVESVAWVSERKDVLYAFFYMLSVHQYLSYVRSGKFRPYLFSLALAIMSVLAKSMAVSLPLVLLLLDRMEKRKLTWRVWWEKAPFFIGLLSVVGVTYVFNERVLAASLAEAVLVWVWTFTFYLKTFLFPAELSPLYTIPSPVNLANVEYAAALGIFVLFTASLYHWRRNRWWTFAGAYYFLSIFFLLRFNKDIMVSAVADRFMYLPALGFCLWAGWGAERLISRARGHGPAARMSVGAALAAALVILGALTFRQCRIWGDEEQFWSRAVKRAPGYVSYINLARYYGRQGRHGQAIEVYRKALGQDPARDYWVYNDIGMSYLSLNDNGRALEAYNRSLELNPQSAETYLLRAFLYQRTQDYDRAFDDYTRTVQLEPRFALAYHNRALIYYKRMQFQPAIQDLGRAIEIVPDFVTAYYFRGQIFGMTGDKTKALQDMEAVLRIEPRHKGALECREHLLKGPPGNLPYVLDVPPDTFKRPQWDPFAYKNYMADRERLYSLTPSSN